MLISQVSLKDKPKDSKAAFSRNIEIELNKLIDIKD